ncbi:hypothetical protein [Nocardia caishijiensis]|uniref:DUF4190 domain-containing protein n=1 Tax=Nocardia caishijiensis TaxID=184756 RepID=A0ABQ6YM62_9NOCA|nr:hypothetical protein [Nocardia caishijiensis]KAF0846753.1 hypothetical protein FNL39_104175 [Nocardia caishijiensis]
MARYEQWDDDPEEEFEDRRWNGQRWPHATPDDATRDDQPRVNPYAMVALAAALVLLFPIAIVFALLSYGHPRGRGIATLALFLGIAEVAAIAVAGMVLFGGLELEMPALATKAATSPVAVTTTEVPPSVGAPTATGSTPVLSQPAASVVQKGTPCQPEQVGLLGVAADGATLLCLRADNAHTWSGPHRVAGSYYTEGESCDPSQDKTGRTTDNHALVCEGKAGNGSWVLWTE